jgi:hypothetical protein
MWRAERFALILATLLAAGALAAPAPAVEPAAPEADAEFAQIVSAATPATRAESCERMQRWVDAHPSSALAARGLVWMSQLQRADRRAARARPLLERVAREFPATEWSLHAAQGLAELDVEEHRYSSAIARYEMLARSEKPLWKYLGENGAEGARGEQVRFAGVLIVAAAIALLAMARLSRSGLRALWPPPAELLWLAPVLSCVLLAGLAQEHDEARAVAMLALGAAALLWLNGAHLRARPPARPVALYVGLGALQFAGLLYCALVTNHLWHKLIDTIAMRPE